MNDRSQTSQFKDERLYVTYPTLLSIVSVITGAAFAAISVIFTYVVAQHEKTVHPGTVTEQTLEQHNEAIHKKSPSTFEMERMDKSIQSQIEGVADSAQSQARLMIDMINRNAQRIEALHYIVSQQDQKRNSKNENDLGVRDRADAGDVGVQRAAGERVR